MSELFGRVVLVQVGTIALSALRVAFRIEKTTKPEPNPSSVEIYNLTEDNRQKLSREKNSKMAISAGYVGTSALIYSGDIRQVQHVKKGSDWVTTVTAGDGGNAYRNAFVSSAFAAGSPVTTVVKELAATLGVGPGNVDSAMAVGSFRRGITQYSSGYSAHGPAHRELTRVLSALGLEWSIQDGQLQILQPAEVLPGTALLLSARTKTLVGSPEYSSPNATKGAPTLTVKTLLQPAIRPGIQVQVESANVNGYFKVRSCVHAGDTHGGEWSTTIEATAV